MPNLWSPATIESNIRRYFSSNTWSWMRWRGSSGSKRNSGSAPRRPSSLTSDELASPGDCDDEGLDSSASRAAHSSGKECWRSWEKSGQGDSLPPVVVIGLRQHGQCGRVVVCVCLTV